METSSNDALSARDQSADVIDSFIDELKSYQKGPFPKLFIEQALEQKELIIPRFLRILESTLDNVDNAIETDGWLLSTVAQYVLAYFKVTEAFPLYLRICRMPPEKIHEFLGDSLTEDFHQMLASTFNGDIASLQSIALDRSLDEFARDAANHAQIMLYRHGILTRENIISYLRSLFTKLHDDPSFVLSGVVSHCCDIHATELLPEIRDAFAHGRIDPIFIDLSFVMNVMNEPRDKVLSKLNSNSSLRYIEHPVTELEHWASFREDDDEEFKAGSDYLRSDEVSALLAKDLDIASDIPFRRTEAKIGRNEPCPCGSGKKYKKCCIDKAVDNHRKIDQLMQEGYDLEESEPERAALVWWETWHLLRKILTPAIRQVDDVDRVWQGMQYISNWITDFEILLFNLSHSQSSWSSQAIRLIDEFLATFPDEEDEGICSFLFDRAILYALGGNFKEATLQAEAMILRWPKWSVGYVSMAEVLERQLDLEKLASLNQQLMWLEKAKSNLVVDGPDYDLDRRIGEVRSRLLAYSIT